MLVAQGDGPAALAAYRKSLAIGEALAARDPANASWAVDISVSCAKLGTLTDLLSADERRAFLERGAGILAELKAAGRLVPNMDRTGWFAERLRELSPRG